MCVYVCTYGGGVAPAGGDPLHVRSPVVSGGPEGSDWISLSSLSVVPPDDESKLGLVIVLVLFFVVVLATVLSLVFVVW